VSRILRVDTTPLTTASTPTSPTNLTIVTTARPTFRWTSVAGAGKYRLQVDDDPLFGSPNVNLLVTGITYTIPSTSPALAQGIYNWRVLAIDPAGNEGANWSTSPQFTVNIQTTPANGAFSTDTTPLFTWTRVTGATNHILQVATNTTFTSLVSGYPVTVGNVASYTPTTPLAGGTYYWRVLTNGETPVDVVYRTLFIGAAPPAPTLIYTANAAFVNDTTPTLQWNAVTPPTGVVLADYEIQVATNAAFSVNLQTFTSATPSLTPGTPLSEGLKYWRVRARFDVSSPGVWSTVRSFTVDVTPPLPPNLTIPANGATITTTRTPRLVWVASATANRYVVDVATDAGFTNLVVNQVVVTTTSYTIPSALASGTYYWRISARDVAGNTSAPSGSRSFVIAVP
jgi:hypothetical protein